MDYKEFDPIKEKLQNKLDEMRYEHTLGVMYTAGSLAMAYGQDIRQAMLAGLLHDCAKCIPNAQKMKMCKKNDIEISEMEEKNPSLLHAKLGAFLAEDLYGVMTML